MNPSKECMRKARADKREALLDMRRWDVARRLKALQLPESGSHDMLSRIAKTVYPTTAGWTREACESLRDHLVELIGGIRAPGAQCDQSHTISLMSAENETKKSGHMRTRPENDDSVSKNNDDTSITDEMRKFVETYLMNNTLSENEKWLAMTGKCLLGIADRIDAQFAQICKQQEKVFQAIISGMLDEVEQQKTLREKNAELAANAITTAGNYLDLLRDAARDYKALQDKLNLVFDMWVSATNGGTPDGI